MGKVTVLNIVLLSLISLCKASEITCKRPTPISCKSHAKCGKDACLGNEGKKICRKCTCTDRSQCRWSKEGKQVCECSAGLTGDNCECKIAQLESGSSTVIDYDPCITNPCENGKCHKEVTGYTCTCPAGYTGNCLRVNSNLDNLAKGYKSVTASSSAFEGSPEKAVDGNKNTLYYQHVCFHSHPNDNNPSWKVELMAMNLIKRVVITNRLDCCSERLKNLKIYVDDKECATYEGPAVNIKTLEIVCSRSDLYGTIVTIHGSHLLTLCEVELYGWK